MEVDIIEKGFFQKLSKMNECGEPKPTFGQKLVKMAFLRIAKKNEK